MTTQQQKPSTRIRIGAAHYDIEMKVGDLAHRLDIADLVRDATRQERHSRLTTLAGVISDFHGLRQRPKHEAQPAATAAPAKRPRASKPAEPRPARRVRLTLDAGAML